MELIQIANHIINRFKNGFQYKKAGKNISQKSSTLIDGLYAGAKIEYNARPMFHSIK